MFTNTSRIKYPNWLSWFLFIPGFIYSGDITDDSHVWLSKKLLLSWDIWGQVCLKSDNERNDLPATSNYSPYGAVCNPWTQLHFTYWWMNHVMVESWFKEPGDWQSVHYFQSDRFNLPSSYCSTGAMSMKCCFPFVIASISVEFWKLSSLQPEWKLLTRNHAMMQLVEAKKVLLYN